MGRLHLSGCLGVAAAGHLGAVDVSTAGASLVSNPAKAGREPRCFPCSVLVGLSFVIEDALRRAPFPDLRDRP